MLAIGTHEGLMVLGIIVLLFGGRKIPELARSMGEGIREFRKSSRALAEEDEKVESVAAEKA